MAMRRTAAPPIAIPAMAPVLSLSGSAGAVPDVGAAELLASLGAAVMVATDVTVVGLLLAVPEAVRFT
jgi:hypothetical protein